MFARAPTGFGHDRYGDSAECAYIAILSDSGEEEGGFVRYWQHVVGRVNLCVLEALWCDLKAEPKVCPSCRDCHAAQRPIQAHVVCLPL